jgi:hypothetical protein
VKAKIIKEERFENTVYYTVQCRDENDPFDFLNDEPGYDADKDAGK